MLHYERNTPAIDDFWTLFETTGWNQGYALSQEELATALENSWLCISAYVGDQLVGFGRVVTDQAVHAMIYDLIVHPDFQAQGIGGEILGRLVESCVNANIRDIQLFSAEGKSEFYLKRGFETRPVEAPGMQYKHG
jgi:ribosomal protein S18 acetylase RimI-like enzyme